MLLVQSRDTLAVVEAPFPRAVPGVGRPCARACPEEELAGPLRERRARCFRLDAVAATAFVRLRMAD